VDGHGDRARRDWLILFPLLVPAVLLAAGNDDFGFDPPGFLDSFVYVGYFWHYPEHLWVFDDNSNYKISRLPWVLPGYVLHALMGTVAGSLVLAYLAMAAGAAALYLLLRDSLHNRTVAAVVGVAWAGCTWAHGIGGWSYHMMAASAYYLMACWLVVRAARGQSPHVVSGFLGRRSAWREGGSRTSVLSSTMAGVFLASAVHTYVFLVTFTPLVALLYFAALPVGSPRPMARSARVALHMVGGGILITLALAAVNRATGGAWLFFMPQIEAAWKYSQPAADIWSLDATRWLPLARYLVIPAAFLAAGLAVPFHRRRDPDRRVSIAFVASAWAALAIMCYFQFVRRQVALDYSYHAFPLYLHAFPCVGAALAGWARGQQRQPALLVGLATLSVLGPLLLLLPTPLPHVMDATSAFMGLARFPSIVGPMALSLAGVAAMSLLPGRAGIVTFALWFSVVNGWIAPDPSSYGIGTRGYRAQMIEMFREADRFTTELDPSLRGIKYWLSNEEITTATGVVQTRAVFDSFVATRAWFTNLLGRVAPSPPIDQLTIDDLERGVCIGVLSSVGTHATLTQEIEAQYAKLGRPLQRVAARQFARKDLSFALTVLGPASSTAAADAGAPSCVRPGT